MCSLFEQQTNFEILLEGTMLDPSMCNTLSPQRSRRGSYTPAEISIALRVMGFHAWKDLEPGE